MIKLSPFRRVFAGASLFVFLFTSVAFARPLPRLFAFDDDAKTLPKVNWIRSRKIDVKHILIDLKFDWDKDQALGVSTLTVAPFADTDTITLDAAMMTINSVTLANGTPLKFTYDGKDGDDNLKITLDRVYKAGEDVSVKVDYRTN